MPSYIADLVEHLPLSIITKSWAHVLLIIFSSFLFFFFGGGGVSEIEGFLHYCSSCFSTTVMNLK